eukprot:1427090-Alexandrium_andersonii.AAC.1
MAARPAVAPAAAPASAPVASTVETAGPAQDALVSAVVGVASSGLARSSRDNKYAGRYSVRSVRSPSSSVPSIDS